MKTVQALTSFSLALALMGSVGWMITHQPSIPAAPSPEGTAPAPTLTLQRLDGTDLDTERLQGKVVLLEVWATWCAQCTREIPLLNRLHRRYRDRGLEVLGVTIESGSGTEVARIAEAQLHVAYPLALGSAEFAAEFGPVWGIPVTLLIDRGWRIRRSWTGAIPDKARILEEEIERLLAEPAS